MKEKKKWVALLLTLAVVLAALVGCSHNSGNSQQSDPSNDQQQEENELNVTDTTENNYSEHYDYTASYIGASGAEVDEMYSYICEKFNVDFEMISYGWSDYASNASLMINGGTMLDMLTVDTGFDAISSYAEQGLIRALPNNWQETYPNIYTYIKNSDLEDVITEEDGKVYCIPKAIYAHFTEGDTYLQHRTLYYRADWAEELGFEFGDTVTISEVAEFAKACIENNMGGNGRTVGLTLRSGLLNELMNLYQPSYNAFVKIDGKYVWGPTQDNVVPGIQSLKTLYNDGILDPDFYINENGAEMTQFVSGRAACMIYDGLVGSYSGLITDMISAGVAADKDDALAKTNVTVLVNDDGAWNGNQVSNYCWATVFSNDMTEEEFLRLLDLLDWMYSREGELVYNLGIENEAWFEQEENVFKIIYYDKDGNMATADSDNNLYALTRNADDTFTVGEQIGSLSDENNTYEAISYPSKAFWFRQAILGDDFMLADPAADPTIVERITRCYATRYENAMEYGYTPIDNDYTFYTSTAKDEYSVGIGTEILRIIADTKIPVEDVQTEWNTFIENNRVMWEPLLTELNETFAD